MRRRCDLLAPDLIVAEIANILWKKAQRGEISKLAASIAASLLANAGIEYVAMGQLLVRLVELAMTLAHPAYDCLYLVAAMDLDTPFVTADTRLLNKLRQQGFDAISYFDLMDAVVG